MTHSELRVATGDSTMLSVEAQAWLAQLPAPVRLHGVAAHAPELANRLAAGWEDVPGTAELLEGLLVETVRSMPDMMVAELLRLYEYHVRCRCPDGPSTAWELPVVPFPGDGARRPA